MRDEFPDEVKRKIAERAGFHCSNPECCAQTHGPQMDPRGSVNVGVAGHICAASPGGPRYDAAMLPEDRRHPNNGIWLCQTCAKLVDNDVKRYDLRLLKEWKSQAEKKALKQVGRPRMHLDLPSIELSSAEEELLCSAAKSHGEIHHLSADQLGNWVRAGFRDFLDQTDPSVSAKYNDALDTLCQRGFVKHDDQSLYRLTGRGFELAKQVCLKASESNGASQSLQ